MRYSKRRGRRSKGRHSKGRKRGGRRLKGRHSGMLLSRGGIRL